jgi:hypothetical protein
MRGYGNQKSGDMSGGRWKKSTEQQVAEKNSRSADDSLEVLDEDNGESG